jgi:hypothetical protein
MALKLTEEEIEAGKSEEGGFTRACLANWGVPWPPPKGWRQALREGRPIPKHGEVQPRKAKGPNPYYDEWLERKQFLNEYTNEELHILIRQIVMASINNGHASDLYEFPSVLAYFGAKLPEK